MFNYMLVVFGIFAAGVVNSLDKHLPTAVTAGLCFIASISALIFARLDRRNRDLVWLGEDVLMHLEREEIFGSDVEIEGRYETRTHFGILWRQALEERCATARIRSMPGKNAVASLIIRLRDGHRGKHRVWLPLVSYLIAGLFLCAGILILCLGPFAATPKP
jgi:hypothetical protein